MVVLTAFVLMVSATLIQHLGLSGAVLRVVEKIVGCGQCFTFWTIFFALLFMSHHIVVSVALAVVMAYLSNWFVLFLVVLQRKFNKFYEEEKSRKNGS